MEMDTLQYALHAYNLLLDLVGLIVGAFLGPLRYAVLVVAAVGIAWLGFMLVIWRRRRHTP
jgi:hypothetical protein